jgi:hypothetical protein
VSSNRAEIYTRYPISSILIYNGVTFLHFLLGGIGIALGYGLSDASYLFGALYLAFAFVQMYVLMPLTLCHNNLYLAALILPIIAMLPALVLNFSFALLIIFLSVVGLLLFRFFAIFTRIACLHCNAKYECPNAAQTGVRDM